MLLRFKPIYQQRVWGGRTLETLFHRTLPPDAQPYGESWELVDRPEAQSIVANGPLAGKTLHTLWTEHRAEIFGPNAPQSERFPLLLKILDAQDVLSLQVHPPAEKAQALGGEPKTEMWVIAHAEPQARLYAGVQPGTTRESFAQALQAETADALVPSLPVTKGDFIFIPSGRLHAIGAGLLIFEIQQNSDTTYRVYDWGRRGLDGQPRELHIDKSLESIDFTDTAPALGAVEGNTLVNCPYFHVSQHKLPAGTTHTLHHDSRCRVLITVEGTGQLESESLAAGDHLLVSASHPPSQLEATTDLWVLEVLV